MKRKVIELGGKTLLVSLPSQWAKAHGVKKGSEINVLENSRGLSVFPDSHATYGKAVSVDISCLNEDTVKSLLSVLHKSGYDEIELIFDSPKIVKTVRERIQTNLIGYEIVEQTNKRCVVKSVSKDYEGEFSNILRRMFLVTLSLAKSAYNSLAEQKTEDIRELLVLEETNNKLTNYCHRLLNKKGCSESKEVYLYVIISILESIADDYKALCTFLHERKILKAGKGLLKMFEEVNNLLEDYYHLFYKHDLISIKEFREKHSKVTEELRQFVNVKNREEAVISIYLNSITKRIYDCLGSTTGLQF